jgi:hypothetical protein
VGVGEVLAAGGDDQGARCLLWFCGFVVGGIRGSGIYGVHEYTRVAFLLKIETRVVTIVGEVYAVLV